MLYEQCEEIKISSLFLYVVQNSRKEVYIFKENKENLVSDTQMKAWTNLDFSTWSIYPRSINELLLKKIQNLFRSKCSLKFRNK